MNFFPMHKIVFTNKSLKDLENIPPETNLRIAQKLKEYSSNPLNYARKLKDSTIGDYRFRIGDYRVVFDLEKDTIVVLRIGHRKDIYK